MTDKVSKESVNYRHAQFGKQRCENCSMFRENGFIPGPGTCTLVQGLISAQAVCDKWEPKNAAQAR